MDSSPKVEKCIALSPDSVLVAESSQMRMAISQTNYMLLDTWFVRDLCILSASSRYPVHC